MKKQLFLAVLMLLPALAWADEFTYNGITYLVMDSQLKTVQVQKINNTGAIVIPANVNGYTVKRIGMCGNSGITSITIPSTVDRFVEDAFSGCTGLTEVKINDLTAWCNIHMTMGGETDSYSSNPLRFAHNLYNNYGALYTSVTVPSTITELGDGIFEGASCLTSVTLQSTLKSIGMCCFQDCTGLTEITIPNNVETIGRRAFRGCSNLETVTIGSGVKNIDYLAFNDCSKLSQIVCEAATPPTLETSVFSDNTLNYKTLVVPQGKKSVYQNAAGWGSFKKIVEVGDEGYQFMSGGARYQVINGTTSPYTCMQVNGNYTSNDVVIPSSVYDNKTRKTYNVTTLGEFAFSGIKATMTSLTIPNTVTRIKEWALWRCLELKRLNISDLTAYCNMEVEPGQTAVDNNPTYYSHNLYQNNQEIVDLSIPNGVTEIKMGKFIDCTNFKTVSIPASVNKIGMFAFTGCSSLQTITMANATPPELYAGPEGQSPFDNDAYYKVKVVVPKGALANYQNNAKWNKFWNIVEYGGTGYEFEYSGFRYKILENNPSTSTYTCEVIKANASANVVIPTSGYCNELGLSFTVTSIGTAAFSGMKDIMTQVTIPATVKRVKEDAFKGCNALTRVNINDLKAFCEMVVEDSQTAFDNHPTFYAHHLYQYNSEITALSIPSGVTTIQAGTFAGCSGFKSVTFHTSVEGIGYAAFTDCSGLTELTFPNSVKAIGHGAFSGCTSLTKVNFGTGLTDIWDYAFYNCDNLSTIEMASSTPPTVHTVTDSESHAFDGKTSSALYKAIVIVPKGAVTAYRNNSEWNRFTNIVELWGVGYPFEVNNVNYVILENNNVAVARRAGGYSGYVSFPTSVYANNTNYTVTTFGSNAFAGCTNMTSITIPATLTRIKEGAFAGCTGLTAVYISDLAAFCNIDVEDNVTAEDNHPTYYAHHLYLNGKEIRDLAIPNVNTVTVIKPATFAGLTSLTSVSIPGRVTGIGYHAFAACSSLKSVIIPSSVTGIASGAFQNCTSLTTLVSLRSSAPECGLDPFYNMDMGKCVLWVPRGCKTNYTGANYWNSFLYTNELIMGDANVDGAVNAADIVEAVNAKRNAPSTRFIQYNVDQTGNGVDASDINAIVNKVMGK